MFRKLNRKTFGLAASLVLAGGAISGTAASAQYYDGPLGGCWDQISSMCNLHWQAWSYMSYAECETAESCYACPDSTSNCPAINWLDNNEVSRHDSHGH